MASAQLRDTRRRIASVEAIKNAIDDSGINKDEIDAVLTKYPTSQFQPMFSSHVAQALGIVSMVVPKAKLGEELARVRTTIAKNSAPVLRAGKAFLTASSETSFATRRDYAAMVNAAAMAERFR